MTIARGIVSKHIFRRTARDEENRLQTLLDRRAKLQAEVALENSQDFDGAKARYLRSEFRDINNRLREAGVDTRARNVRVKGRWSGWWRVEATS